LVTDSIRFLAARTARSITPIQSLQKFLKPIVRKRCGQHVTPYIARAIHDVSPAQLHRELPRHGPKSSLVDMVPATPIAFCTSPGVLSVRVGLSPIDDLKRRRQRPRPIGTLSRFNAPKRSNVAPAVVSRPHPANSYTPNSIMSAPGAKTAGLA